jgi:hypothetical protein
MKLSSEAIGSYAATPNYPRHDNAALVRKAHSHEIGAKANVMDAKVIHGLAPLTSVLTRFIGVMARCVIGEVSY